MNFALAALKDAVASSGSGYPGSINADALPDGWASVAYFPYSIGHDLEDVANDYVGPILEENADYIVIDVFGDRMTFPKSRVIVTYPR